MDATKVSVSDNSGPKGWRRMILPLRWISFRLLLPLFLHQAERCAELEASSAETDRWREFQERELSRLRGELADLRQAIADARGEARAEVGSLDQRVRQALALGWDHVALVRRLASIEDHLNSIGSKAGGSFDPRRECEPSKDDPGPTVLSVPQAKRCG